MLLKLSEINPYLMGSGGWFEDAFLDTFEEAFDLPEMLNRILIPAATVTRIATRIKAVQVDFFDSSNLCILDLLGAL